MIAFEKSLRSLSRSNSEDQPLAQPTEAVPSEKKAEKAPLWKTALKYWLHGLPFSILPIVLGLFFGFFAKDLAPIVAFLSLGGAIGYIIGFMPLVLLLSLLFTLFLGGLNSFLTGMIWSISIDTQLRTLLEHGIVLFVVFLAIGPILFSMLNIVALIFLPAEVAYAVLYVFICAFICGFIGRNIGEHIGERV